MLNDNLSSFRTGIGGCLYLQLKLQAIHLLSYGQIEKHVLYTF